MVTLSDKPEPVKWQNPSQFVFFQRRGKGDAGFRNFDLSRFCELMEDVVGFLELHPPETERERASLVELRQALTILQETPDNREKENIKKMETAISILVDGRPGWASSISQQAQEEVVKSGSKFLRGFIGSLEIRNKFMGVVSHSFWGYFHSECEEGYKLGRKQVYRALDDGGELVVTSPAEWKKQIVEEEPVTPHASNAEEARPPSSRRTFPSRHRSFRSHPRVAEHAGDTHRSH